MKRVIQVAGLLLTLALAAGFAGASAQTQNGVSPLLSPSGQTIGGATVTPSAPGATVTVNIYQDAPFATYNVCISQPVPGVIQGSCAGGAGSSTITTDKFGNGTATVNVPIPLPTTIVVVTNAGNSSDTAQAIINTNFPFTTYCLVGC